MCYPLESQAMPFVSVLLAPCLREILTPCCCLSQLEAKESLVAPTSENIFTDQFWEGLDFVTNALDNVKARLYVDTRCDPTQGSSGLGSGT